MLPYTAIDAITAMDRTFAFDDYAPDATNRHGEKLRRSRQMLIAAAMTLLATTRS